MGSPFQIEVDLESGNAQQNLKLLTDRTGPGLSGFMNTELVQYIQGRARDRFANEGDDAVGAWAPLQPSTEVRRAAKGYPPSHPINVRSGDLRSYIVGDRGNVSGGADFWELTWPNTPPSQDLLEKTQTAQLGSAFPNTVARPVVGLSPKDLDGVTQELWKFISEGLM